MNDGSTANSKVTAHLQPAELELLAKLQSHPADSVHGLITASPSLERKGVRRNLLLEALAPKLSQQYQATLSQKPARHLSGFGALPAAAYDWSRRKAKVALLDNKSPPTKPQTSIDLLSDIPAEKWIVREQLGRPNCVAHAVTACVELMQARRRRTAVMPLSSRFLDERLRARRKIPLASDHLPCSAVPAHATEAKLCEAANALMAEGICLDSTWDEVGPKAESVPGQVVFAEALLSRAKVGLYEDRPDEASRLPGLSMKIYRELRAGRPVAVALPGFRDQDLDHGPTGWDRDDVWLTGIVPDPGDDDEPVPGSGHAVCIVGFQVSAAEKSGGYFVFRNSWDTRFGRLASDPAQPHIPPYTPMPGYGTISATHIDWHCWEALSIVS